MPSNIPDNEIQWDDAVPAGNQVVSAAIEIPDNAIQWDEPKASPKLVAPERSEHPAKKYTRGLGRSVLGGTLLSFGDEAAAGTAALAAKLTGNIPEGQTIADAYKDIKGNEAIQQGEFVEANPKTAFGAELAGGLLTAGLTGGGSMAGAGSLGQVAKVGAVQGGKLGAVYGAGSAETGDTLGESALNTAIGAGKGLATGVITGGILTPTLVGTGRVLGAAAKNVSDRLLKSEAEKAQTYVKQLAEQSGYTPEQLAERYAKLGPQATLADLSENLLSGAKAAVDQIGPTKEAARGMARSRQLGQLPETLGILSKQLGGVTGDDAAAALAKNAQERSVQAGPLYESALKSVVPQSEQLQKLQALPAFKQAYSQAGTYAANDLSRVAKEADPNMIGGAFKAGKLTEAEKLHYAKQALYDMESAQARAGNTNAAKQIGDARKSLTDVLDSIPGYKEARGIWSGSMGQEEALNTGRQLFKMTGREFDDAVKGMNEHEKQMARMGLMDAVEEKLGSVADTQNTAGKLVRDSVIRKKLSSLLDADQMKALEDNASKWDRFTATKNKLTGGSPTTENQTVQQESAQMIAAAGSPLDQAKNKLFEFMTNPNRMTKENAAEIGSILTKQGMSESEVLQALQQIKKDPTKLRDLMNAGKNAMLVDYVPAGGATIDAAFPKATR